MTEYELFQALRPLYPAAEYALLPQVANATGARTKRHCDALALSLWPSRGLHLHGFEMKSYRGDWIRELRNPEKAEEIAGRVQYWWVVASAAFVPVDELPPGWGLLVWDDKAGKLVKVKAAPFRQPAAPLDLPFLAAVLRQAQGVCTPDAVLAEAKREAYEQGIAEGKLRQKHEAVDYLKLSATVNDFEKVSGIKIRDRWQGGKEVGAAVKAVMDGTVENRRRTLLQTAKMIVQELEPESE